MKAGLALVAKASEICVPFVIRPSLSQSLLEETMLELLRGQGWLSREVADVFGGSVLYLRLFAVPQRLRARSGGLAQRDLALDEMF